MRPKTITCKIIRDFDREVSVTKLPFMEDRIYYFGIPREDLSCWRVAQIEITVTEDNEIEGL